MHRRKKHVIPRRGEAPTWESPSNVRTETENRQFRKSGGDCHVALRAPRNDMHFNNCATKRSFISAYRHIRRLSDNPPVPGSRLPEAADRPRQNRIPPFADALPPSGTLFSPSGSYPSAAPTFPRTFLPRLRAVLPPCPVFPPPRRLPRPCWKTESSWARAIRIRA